MPDTTNLTTLPQDRVELARFVLDIGSSPQDAQPRITMPAAAPLADLGLPWPAGLAPKPAPLEIEPDTSDPLPRADVLVVTWTVPETEALADVLTPGFNRDNWYRYDRGFQQHYRPNIRGGAPSLRVQRLGSYFPTKIGAQKVLCFKSELHLNQDGKKTGEGTATLPVKDLWLQMIKEVRPRLVISTGTAGATLADHDLGDVIITRAAKFHLTKEFRNENFASAEYRCKDYTVPTGHMATAEKLITVHKDRLTEPAFGPPTKRYKFDQPLIAPPKPKPDIKLDGKDFKAFHPIVSTDFFEIGTSSNGMDKVGCGVEMGDAVLGLVVKELEDAGQQAPQWLIIRNASDPQINGDLPDNPRALNMQAHWAVWYYSTYGYWTSVNSAIATWAVVAG